jgi:nucleotide-binding universal stress UspA family protein
MRILVAIDGSSAGNEALNLAGELLAGRDATITILHVIPRHRVRTKCGALTVEYLDLDAERATAAQLLEGAEQRLRCAGLGPRIETKLDVGDPSSSILAAVEASQSDLLLLGYRGLSRVQRFLVGAVSTRVVTHATCSVIVAHPKRETVGDTHRASDHVRA